MIWKNLGTGERYALIILFGFGLLLGCPPHETDGAAALVRNLLGLLAFVILFLCLGAGAVLMLFIGGQGFASRWRAIGDRILPVAALMTVLAFVSYSADRAVAAFARDHAEELSPPYPSAAIYAADIPDGGTAILASPGRNPETFSSRQGLVLTEGGNIRSCDKIDARLWKCSFG